MHTITAAATRGWTTLLTLLCLGLAIWLPSSATAAEPTTGTVTVVAQVNYSTGPVVVPGVQFTLSRIQGVDPHTPQGQALLATYQKSPSLATPHLIDTRSFPLTDVSGQATLSGLPLGAYLIHEVSRPTSRTLAEEKVTDFVFALPSANLEGVPVYNLVITPKPQIVLPPKPTPTPTVSPSPSSTPSVQPPKPQDSDHPSGVSINAGGGDQFSGTEQMLLIGIGIGLLLFAGAATRRRRGEHSP